MEEAAGSHHNQVLAGSLDPAVLKSKPTSPYPGTTRMSLTRPQSRPPPPVGSAQARSRRIRNPTAPRRGELESLSMQPSNLHSPPSPQPLRPRRPVDGLRAYASERSHHNQALAGSRLGPFGLKLDPAVLNRDGNSGPHCQPRSHGRPGICQSLGSVLCAGSVAKRE